MTKRTTFSILVIVLVLVGIGGFMLFSERAAAPVLPVGDAATVPVLALPVPGTASKSPLQVAGIAPGNWYFEASFPIELRTKDGQVILGAAPAHATDDWMTAKPVHFSTTISFKITKKTEALIVLKNDNPSGDPARDKSYEVPVTLLP